MGFKIRCLLREDWGFPFLELAELYLSYRELIVQIVVLVRFLFVCYSIPQLDCVVEEILEASRCNWLDIIGIWTEQSEMWR